MKVTRRYCYKLTEKTIDEDIDKFISNTRKGLYGMDRRYGGEGLRIIKEYFRILDKKFKNNEFKESAKCYKKLILFLFDSSTGRDKADFGYEDLLSQVSKDFDKIIEKYFLSILKVYSGEDLVNECYDYIIKLNGYGFDLDKEMLIKNLEREKLDDLIEELLLKTFGMTKGDRDKHNVIYFLMEIYEELGEREKYLELCGRFEGVLSEEELEYFINNFDEGTAEKDFPENKLKLCDDNTKINGVCDDDESGRGV